MNEPKRPKYMPEQLDSIADPMERIAAAADFIDYARYRLGEGVRVRNAAIREARTTGRSRASLAEVARISVAAVKAVIA